MSALNKQSGAGVDVRYFLQAVVPWDGNYVTVHWRQPGPEQHFHGRSCQSVDDVLRWVDQIKAGVPADIWFCISSQTLNNGHRDRKHAAGLVSIPIDLDIKADSPNHYPTLAEAIANLVWSCDRIGIPRPSFLIASGGGLHGYWISDRVLLVEEWQPFANAIKAGFKADGLKFDAVCTGDAARVMRVPGTKNWKYDDGPRPVRLLQSTKVNYGTGAKFDFAEAFKNLNSESKAAPKTADPLDGIEVPEAFKHIDPKVGLADGIVFDDTPLPLEPILAGCPWLRQAFETGGKDFDEPQWYLSTLASTFIENGHELAHQLGNQHKGYTRESTEEKLAHANHQRQTKDIGYPQCKTIEAAGSKHCKDCPHSDKGGSPLNLGRQYAAPDNGLPELVIGHEPTAVAKELTKLIAQGDHYFFNGHAPVRIAVEVDDMPRAIPVTAENVRVLAHEISNPVKWVKQRKFPAEIRTDVANIYLRGLEGRWGLKRFVGIATTPILSGDGTVRNADGYDPATGLWCHNIPALDILENPSEREASAALKQIRHTFRTFPFADAARVRDNEVEVVDPDKPVGLDESAFLVALLTATCRPSLETAPGFLCDAPSFSGAGTGKGYLVKAVCITASGARPHAFTSGHDAAEFDKRLSAALIQGRPAIFLDNFNAKELTSDTLASALTENPAQVRIMGHTKMVPLHVCTFIAITGNGVEIAEDMARRLLKTHLDARMENPEERKFKPGFLDDIFTQRCSLLASLLTIWRWGRRTNGGLSAGRPLGGFETWAQWVRDPLLNLGLRDPVDRIAEIKANDPKRRTLVEIFGLWHETFKEKPVTASELGPEIIQRIDIRARQDNRGHLQYSRQMVARFLAQRVGTQVGGYVLQQGERGPPSKRIAIYTLVRTTSAT